MSCKSGLVWKVNSAFLSFIFISPSCVGCCCFNLMKYREACLCEPYAMVSMCVCVFFLIAVCLATCGSGSSIITQARSVGGH